MILSTTTQVVITIVAIACYFSSFAMYLQRLSKATFIENSTAIASTCLGVLLHGLIAYTSLNTTDGIDLGIQSSSVLVTWVISVFLLLALIRLRVSSLFVVILPLSITALIFSLLGDSSYLPRTNLTSALIIHILLSIIAYSTLFMASSQALVLAIQERNLRNHEKIRIVRLLPPLETMERLLFWLLWLGIAFLTLAIASGFMFMESMFAQHVVHHTVLSTSAWLMYAVLLTGHKVFGWRGIRAIKWTLLSFGLLVLGYFGSKFVLEIVLIP